MLNNSFFFCNFAPPNIIIKVIKNQQKGKSIATQPHRPYIRRGAPVKREALHKINEFISAPTVRLVGDNIEPQITTLRDALTIADRLELDLVEISPQASPPVCKIMDYQKFLYEQKKKAKDIKAKSAKIVIKRFVSDHILMNMISSLK